MMTTEVARLDPADLQVVDREQAALMVTKALEESKSWLAVAMKGTDPTPIAAFKAWAATVEEATKQKKLGHEIELAAAEMVRRAERGIGVAIRAGQEAGEIAKVGDLGANPAPRLGGITNSPRNEHLVRPADAAQVTNRSELVPIYDLTDGVTDKQFEEAITEAKGEQNLSRANVIRKVKGLTGPSTPGERRQRIGELAQSGHSSQQMSAELGILAETVRKIARGEGIPIPADDATIGRRRIDSNRVVRETTHALEGLLQGLSLVDFDSLDRSETPHWTASLNNSTRALNRFLKQMKEAVQ